jgi:carboxyl-terminal processing protease
MKKLFLALSFLGGIAAGGAAQSAKNHNFEVAKNLDLFNNIYKNLDLMYVDTISPGEVIGSGIKAMLRSLDPYTEYYPEEKTKELKMMLTGKYAGIGALVRYHQRLKRVVIDEPYAGMPAAEVGLKKGDIILQIDDTTMTDKGVSYVSNCLRGDAGTSFVLKIKRPSTGKEMKFKITRRTIKMPELPYYGMRSNGVGYINFNSFTEGSAKDMRRAFIDLKKQGATGLVLDLRGNGGGSLAEAIDIVNMWVPKGLVLVETRGKLKPANKEYKTRLEPIDTVMPIVVLVNGETASASEITSGSLQDMDRGVILGTRTYGKGLVQMPIDLPYNANLKVTTSKYYIPSGRCIQAVNYKHSGGGYTEHIADSLTRVFKTKNGREVRDGGGIKPDVEVRPDTLPNIAVYLDRLDTMEVMFDYVVDYIAKHPVIAPAGEFHITDADFEEFKQRVVSSGFSYDPVSEKQLGELVKAAKFEGYYDDAKAEFDALAKKLKHDVARDMERNRQMLCDMLEQDIVAAYYYQQGVIEAGLNRDKMLDKAMEILGDKQEYDRLLKPRLTD